MFHARKFVAAFLLGLSACGEADRPRSSVVQPLPEPPKVAQVKGEDKAAAATQTMTATPAAAKPFHPWNYNYALAKNGGSSMGGDNSQLLIDGNSTVYDASQGYAMTDWSLKPQQSMLFTLKETVEINTVRF